MKCPHCGGDWKMQICPQCGGETLPEGKFCCHCGAELEVELPPDLANRILCPDGACIGILNEKGECSVCGMAYKAVLESEQSDG
ncbi:hypothetical protein [Desulfobacca acetoxidans]|uniref:DZANK-type domain-containing protein n=1 Tax=Desulfobacca acetoxidans (strain ATCC 700848 / DSM 11109 / ASRB2) TaxID=880072 RepID=F2NGI0_DESAR|nr:hypothetical protein [Desulfobacca acetoxidans]AEB08593.1 hypothetical protein Desac_0713 [Desulfobacca acetoxidans DSM 11109]